MSAPGQEQPPPTPMGQEEQRLEEILDQILGGELPGAGYLFPDAPAERLGAEITETPETARARLLRAVTVCAKAAELPYGMVPRSDLAKAALAFSQAYLLLDPTVDENGVPVGAQATAQGEAQEGAAHAQAEGQLATNEQKHQHTLEQQEHQAALAPDPESFKRPPGMGGNREPPRVQPNAAERQIEAKNKGKSNVLKGARADKPLPRPRVGQ